MSTKAPRKWAGPAGSAITTEAALPPTIAPRERRFAVAGRLGVAAAATAWAFWALNFNVLTIVDGDSTRQFTLVRRIFGEDVDAIGYHFGLALLEAPFYALGKLLSSAGVATVDGVATEEAAVALGSSACVLAAVVLCGRLLAQVGLPFRGSAVLFALFGTPLFYYGTFVPGRTHAFDALLFTLALVVLAAYMRSSMTSVPLVIGLGVVLGLSTTVRYFNAAEVVALVIGLVVLRRARHAAVLSLCAVGTAAVLTLVPWSLGVTLTIGSRGLGFYPLVPLQMLFTEHRGLFVWSPVALLAAVGYARLLRGSSPHRAFFVLAGSMGLAVLLSYAALDAWDGRWSFAQRFLTPLFPLIAIGLAALATRKPKLMLVAASLATAWSVFLALNLETVGPPNDNYGYLDGGAFDLAVQPAERDIGPGAYVWGVRHASRLLP